jgi:mannose-6-phosphate isomerase-like protein (cupin superfamily)
MRSPQRGRTKHGMAFTPRSRLIRPDHGVVLDVVLEGLVQEPATSRGFQLRLAPDRRIRAELQRLDRTYPPHLRHGGAGAPAPSPATAFPAVSSLPPTRGARRLCSEGGRKRGFPGRAADTTAGAFTIFEESEPVDAPSHVHDNELFFALEGERLFKVGEEEFRVGAGGLVFAPAWRAPLPAARGAAHGTRPGPRAPGRS